MSARLSVRTGGISSTTSGDTLLFIFFPFPSIYFVRVKIRCKKKVFSDAWHGRGGTVTFGQNIPRGTHVLLSGVRAPSGVLALAVGLSRRAKFCAESKKDCRPRRLALTPRVFPCQAPNASALRCARLAETFPSLLLSPSSIELPFGPRPERLVLTALQAFASFCSRQLRALVFSVGDSQDAPKSAPRRP